MTPSTRPPLSYDIKTATASIGIGRSKLYEEIKLGRLKARKIGRRTVITHADLQAWMDQLPPQH